MPKYRITGPDGATYDITAPEGASQEQVLSFVQQQVSSKPAAPAAPAAPTDRQQLLASAPMRVAKGMKDPMDGAAQLLQRVLPDSVVNGINRAADAIGGEGTFLGDVLGIKGMTPQQLNADIRDSNAEYERARKATGQDGFDLARTTGNVLSPVNAAVARVVPIPAAGAPVKELAKAGAKAGAVGGITQPVMNGADENFWAQKGGQALAGAAGGAVVTPAVAKGGEALARGAQRMLPPPAVTPQRIEVVVNNTFHSQGVDPREVPDVILQSVRRQAEEAMRAGQKLNPQEMVRRAQFEAVGLTGEAGPTAGQLSRDPTQYANEVNLAQVRIRTPQGETSPLADRFNTQNRRLQDVFDQVGARGATDRVTAGQTMQDALRAADAPVRGAVDDAYNAARAMNGGRDVPLDHGAFSQAANKALDDGMLGHYVPAEIRNMLNDVTTGKQPFTVAAAEQFDSIMSAAQRRAGQGSPEAMAIGKIRQALHSAPFAPAAPATGESAAAAAARTVNDPGAPIVDVPFREVRPPSLPGPGNTLPVTRAPGDVGPTMVQPPRAPGAVPVDEGAMAREAFAQAKAAAAKRFATIEDTPALAAALADEAPDKFVQRYILGADVRDLQAMKKVLENSPEALAQARAQVAEHLKRAAFGANASGDKTFTPERYLEAVRALGPQKLGIFFSPAEMVRLNLAGKVASDINSVPAGARPNLSGTSGALMNLLSKIAESPMLRRMPGARALANHVGEIRTEQQINQALSPVPAQQARELSPETVRALQLLFPATGLTGGVLGGQAVR